MKIDGKEKIVLYLEDWQIRMIKECLGADCENWIVDVEQTASQRPSVKYMVWPPANMNVKRMYLTGWQRREIKDSTGHDCRFIELVESAISRYGVPSDKMREFAKEGKA